MISSSKADVVWGVRECGMWEGGAWGKGKERGPALIKTLPQKKKKKKAHCNRTPLV